jgi:hypothetical protein
VLAWSGTSTARAGIAEVRQTLPRADERLLDRVLREVGISEDEPHDAMQPLRDAEGEDLEGLVVAVSRWLDEVSLHPLAPLAATAAAY